MTGYCPVLLAMWRRAEAAGDDYMAVELLCLAMGL